jgi:hypothetical protein
MRGQVLPAVCCPSPIADISRSYSVRIPSHLIRSLLIVAFVPVSLTAVGEDVRRADQSCAFRAATAEEQKFYAAAFAQFQKSAPPAPAGWIATDTVPAGARMALRKKCARRLARLSSTCHSNGTTAALSTRFVTAKPRQNAESGR